MKNSIKKIVSSTCLLLFVLMGFAQEKVHPNFYGSLSVHSDFEKQWDISVLLRTNFLNTWNKKFSVGLGLRPNYHYLINQKFLSEEKNGFTDTFQVKRFGSLSLNLTAHLHYQITEKLGIGANFDFVSFRFLGERTGTYLPSLNATDNGYNSSTNRSEVQRWGLRVPYLLEKGNYLSEVFMDYKVNNQFFAKAGISQHFIHLETTREHGPNNTRNFTNSTFLLTVGFGLYIY